MNIRACNRLIFITVVLFNLTFASFCSGQTQISISAGVSSSINGNITRAYYSSKNPLVVLYYSYKKYEYPSILLNADFSTPLHKKISFAAKTGFNIHFSEKYLSNYRYTIANMIAQVGLKYNLFKEGNTTGGLYLLSGINFISLREDLYKISPGGLYTGSLFLNVKKHSFKLGIEKEVQNVKYYFETFDPSQQDETIKFKQNRIQLFFTYGLILK